MPKHAPARPAAPSVLRPFLPLLVLVFAFAAVAPTSACGADAKASPAAGSQYDAMVAQMQALAKPGPEHKALEALVGTWQAEVKMWPGPDEPQVSKGEMVNRMIFGGRVLESRYKGSFFGSPMEGYGLMGYDNVKKEYWSTWVDDISTGVMVESGPAAGDGKEFRLVGTAPGPDGRMMPHTALTRIVDGKTYTYAITAKMGDQEMPMMEITYRR